MQSTDVFSVGLTNPSRGVVDFDDWRALKPIYEAASEAGIFVVLRPGMQFVTRPISVADSVRDRSLRKYTKNRSGQSARFCAILGTILERDFESHSGPRIAILPRPKIVFRIAIKIAPRIAFLDGVVRVGAILMAILGPRIAAESPSESSGNHQL